MSLSLRNRFAKLRRMSALRQAVTLTTAFIALMLTAGLIAVSQFEFELQKRIENDLIQRFATVSDDLTTMPFDPARYPATQLEKVEFNAVPEDIRDGFHNLLRPKGGPKRGAENWRSVNGEGQWMYLVGPVTGGQLIVGTNLGRQDDVIEIMLRTMWLVGLGAAFVALLLGVFFGAHTQRRITAISNTLERVGEGDLTARVAAKRRRDDLDGLSHQVDASIARLDVLMRQTRDFAANIAHDLKTPLARLRIRLGCAAQGGDTSPDDIAAALDQTDKIIGIFDAFLRIAKLETGAARAAFEPVNLGVLVQDVGDIYAAVVEDSGRQLSVEISHPFTIQGDRILLVQQLANLIENAVRHTPKGTDIILIADGLTLGLADTGPGIPADEYDKITQPLYRLEKSRTTDGAGLGLSLVQAIATLHAADLVFTNYPASGSSGLYVRMVFDAR